MNNIQNIANEEKCEACGQPLTNNHDAKHHHNEYMKNQKIQNKPLSDAEKHAEFMKTAEGIAMAEQLENAKPKTPEELQAEFMKTPEGIAMAEQLENAKPKTPEELQAEFMKTPEGIAMAEQLENAKPKNPEELQAEFMKTPEGIAFKADGKKLELSIAKHNKAKEIFHKRQRERAEANVIAVEALENPDNEFKVKFSRIL